MQTLDSRLQCTQVRVFGESTQQTTLWQHKFTAEVTGAHVNTA